MNGGHVLSSSASRRIVPALSEALVRGRARHRGRPRPPAYPRLTRLVPLALLATLAGPVGAQTLEAHVGLGVANYTTVKRSEKQWNATGGLEVRGRDVGCGIGSGVFAGKNDGSFIRNSTASLTRAPHVRGERQYSSEPATLFCPRIQPST